MSAATATPLADRVRRISEAPVQVVQKNVIGFTGSYLYPPLISTIKTKKLQPPRDVLCLTAGAAIDLRFNDWALSQGFVVVPFPANKQRYDSQAEYQCRKDLVDRIKDQGGVLAIYAAKDPETKQHTDDVAITIALAERAGIRFDIIETPVPAKACVLIERANRYLENALASPSAGHLKFRQERTVDPLLWELDEHCFALVKKMDDAEPWIEAESDSAKKRDLEDRWLKCEAAYRVVYDFVSGARQQMTGLRDRFAA